MGTSDPGAKDEKRRFHGLGLPSAPSLIPEGIANPHTIAGIGALSSLGKGVEAHFDAVCQGRTAIRAMGEILGVDSPHASLPGAWISPRSLLANRKWSPASMAALHVAKEAVAMAGWSAGERENAALVIGTSRGNAAGWLDPWPGRRPFRLMAASNTIHSEPATAVSIELGILGENHVVASGCSAGLDALGIAKMLLDSGRVEKALVVAVDLPLVPKLLDNYVASGLLGSAPALDPFAEVSDGFIPGEGAAAIALSAGVSGKTVFSHFSNNSDGADPVGVPKDGGRSHLLLDRAVSEFGQPAAICPHATGTQVQARAERTIFDRAGVTPETTFHLLKPFVGHTVGASGLLESVVLLRFLENSLLPPNLAGRTAPCGWRLPDKALPCAGPVFKLAHGMGGHNALAVFQSTT